MSPNTHFAPLILAGIALLCGLSVANVYFNQALLPVFAGALHADAGQTSWIATASQMGYALGMLLIVPLGDRVAPLRLCRLLLVWTAALLLLAGQPGHSRRTQSRHRLGATGLVTGILLFIGGGCEAKGDPGSASAAVLEVVRPLADGAGMPPQRALGAHPGDWKP